MPPPSPKRPNQLTGFCNRAPGSASRRRPVQRTALVRLGVAALVATANDRRRTGLGALAGNPSQPQGPGRSGSLRGLCATRGHAAFDPGQGCRAALGHRGRIGATKKECGLDEYEVQTWQAWHRHITLSLLAHAFLVALPVQVKKGGADRVIPLTILEIRRLLIELLWRTRSDAAQILAWSRWRRRHQAPAMARPIYEQSAAVVLARVSPSTRMRHGCDPAYFRALAMRWVSQRTMLRTSSK